MAPLRERVKAAVEAWDKEGKGVISPVKGGSMEPFLREGDEVTWYLAMPQEIRVGDLVTLLRGGGLIVHRALRVRRRQGRLEVLEKGDAQRIGRWVDGKEVIGRVHAIKRRGRSYDLGGFLGRCTSRLLGFAHLVLDQLVAAKRGRHPGQEGTRIPPTPIC
jgi:hypothetical protein